MKKMIMAGALLQAIYVNAGINVSSPVLVAAPDNVSEWGYYLSDVSKDGKEILITNLLALESGINGAAYEIKKYDSDLASYSYSIESLGMNGSAELGRSLSFGSAHFNQSGDILFTDYVSQYLDNQVAGPIVSINAIGEINKLSDGELFKAGDNHHLIFDDESMLFVVEEAQEGNLLTLLDVPLDEGVFYGGAITPNRFYYPSNGALNYLGFNDFQEGVAVEGLHKFAVYSENGNYLAYGRAIAATGEVGIYLRQVASGTEKFISILSEELVASEVIIGGVSDDGGVMYLSGNENSSQVASNHMELFDLNDQTVSIVNTTYPDDKYAVFASKLSADGGRLYVTRIVPDAIEDIRNMDVVYYNISVTGEEGNFISVNPIDTTIDPYATPTSQFSIDLSGSNVYGLDVSCNVSSASLAITAADYNGVFGSQNSMTLPLVFDAASVTGTETLVAPELPFEGEGSFVLADVVAEFTTEDVDVVCAAEVSDQDGNLLQVGLTPATIRIDDGVHGGNASVSGTIVIPGVDDLSGVEVVLTIDGRQVTVTTDENGNFTFDGLRDGEFTVSLATENYVQSCQEATVADGNSVDLGSIEMLAGDINADGAIDIADFTYMAARYRAQQGDADYDAKADLNSDGIINIQDLAILASHFGSTQCNPVQ